MTTRRTSYALIAAVVSALTLAPCRGAAWPQETDLQAIPVQGRLSLTGASSGPSPLRPSPRPTRAISS